MYKILVVDDEEKIRDLIKKYIEYDGNEAILCSDGMEAIEKMNKEEFHLIIMDVMMPNLDGFSTVRKIREKSQVPVIMLSARGEEYDKINAFEIGVDDYVVKPFSPKELLLRINAILKRMDVQNVERQIINKDNISVDVSGRKVLIDNEEIRLSPKESEVFFYLFKNRNIAVSRESLITEVWGYDYFGDERTLDTHIKQLRKALGEKSDIIKTLRSLGYRLEW